MKTVKAQALLLRKRSLARSLTAAIVFFACAGVYPIAVSAQTTDAPSPSGFLHPSQTSLLKDQPEAVLLEPDKPIQRELAAGQKHVYQITLPAGQYVKVEVRDMGTDVGVNLKLPNGQLFAISDPFGEPPPVKGIVDVAEVSGVYQFQIYAGARATTGRYEIRVADLHPATEADLALHEARKSYRESRRLAAQSKWSDALPLMRHALEIREKILGSNDSLVADTLGALATNYHNLGDYAAEEVLLTRALTISETLGPNDANVVKHLNELAGFYRDKGDYPKAEEYDRRALAILERTRRMDAPLAASTLETLSDIRYAMADYPQAAKLSRQALAVWEKIMGPDHFHLAKSISFSGRADYDAGDYSGAEEMFQRALTLSERALGLNHLSVTGYLDDLAMVYCTTGEYTKGEALYRRALSIYEQSGIIGLPPTRETLFGLARCLEAQGNIREAIEFQMQASEIEEHFVTVNLAAGSQREKQVFLDHLSMHTWRNVSLHLQQAPEDPQALDLAVATVLRRKGRVQDAMSLSLSSLRRYLGGDDQKLLDQLNDLNSRLAKLALAAPQGLSAAERKAEVEFVEGQREALEEEISRRSAGFFQSSKPVTLDAIQAVIPENAALIEFSVYRPFDAKAPDNEKAYGNPHYVAYVIRRRGGVQWQELGEASAIDQAIDGLRQALRDPQRKDVRELARAADELVLRSARALAGDATHLLISPDGQLNLIPFEALVDEQGRYMAERYSISYLTTGRDLLRMQVARASKTRPVIVADPFFGEPGTTKTARSGSQLKAVSVDPQRRNNLPTDDLSGSYFAPLSGTAQEAHAIQSLFPEAELLIGRQATKSTLQQVVAPRILHIATHGFFLQNPAAPSRNFVRSGLNNGPRIYSGLKMEDPLLRSGLALSGANLNQTGNSDGILTALEVSDLNLWGTKLVTLSACETGVGVVKNGEGVYGLRRSFFLAGAETLMMSLWSVSDRTTREMMFTYYAGLKGGLGRGEALHQAELAMMKRKGRSHPFYWASFIQSGEWANLDGKR